MIWSDFRAELRRFLDDETVGKYRWTDARLLDYTKWALNALCAHTALATSTAVPITEAATTYMVPSNSYEPINLAGMIYITRGTQQIYVNPVKYNVATRMGTAQPAFYLMPERVINLNIATKEDDLLNLFYFAYYPYPVNDSDEMLHPAWAQTALIYKAAAHAFSPFGGRSAQIRQWGQKPDTGNPEDNPLKEQSSWYLRMYDLELSNVPRQDRRNYFKV